MTYWKLLKGSVVTRKSVHVDEEDLLLVAPAIEETQCDEAEADDDHRGETVFLKHVESR